MLLINYKVKWKLKWAMHSIFDSGGIDNPNADFNCYFFSLKNTKLYILVIALSPKHSEKLSKLLSKRFERSVYWNDYQRKSENENVTNEYRYFLKSNFVVVSKLFDLVYSNEAKVEKGIAL